MRQLTEKLDALVREAALPYLDIRVYREHTQQYRYCTAPEAENALLQMYSMSKAVTVVAAMGLVEEGRLSLSDLVSDYYPEFRETVYCKDGKTFPNPNPITIRHLLTMTSGMSYHVQTPQILGVTAALGQNACLQDYVGALAKTPLSFPCGEAFQYSLSLDLLAAIVEKITGTRFEDYVAQKIFLPLEMTNATFRNIENGVFPMYECDTQQCITPAPVKNALLFSQNCVSGGAGLVCTTGDYGKLVTALTNGGVAHNGHRLLSRETVEAISAPLLSREFVKNDFFWQGRDYGYGLGVRVRLRDTDWGLKKGEFGWDGAAGSFWLCDPHEKISIVMGMNVLAWENRYLGIHSRIVEQIYRALLAPQG